MRPGSTGVGIVRSMPCVSVLGHGGRGDAQAGGDDAEADGACLYSSEPGLEANDEAGVVGLAARALGEVGGVAECAAPLHADIGGELLGGIRSAAAGPPRPWIRPEPIPSSGMSLAEASISTRGWRIRRWVMRWSYSASTRAVRSPSRRQEGGGVDLPPVGGQALEPEHQMRRVFAVRRGSPDARPACTSQKGETARL